MHPGRQKSVVRQNLVKSAKASTALLRAALTAAVLFAFMVPAGAEDIRFAHCLGGCPQGAPADNALVARAVYTLSFNRQRRVADWVAYIVTPGSIGVATNLSRLPLPDPYIAETLEPSDFGEEEENVGLELNFFAPLVSFAGTPYWRDINYLTNAAPRNREMNRGSWYGLEWAVRNLVNRSDALYVITGPIYDEGKPQPALPTGKAHQVPSGYFKIVANREGQVAAFTFDQDLPFHIHHCQQLTTVADIEAQTGLKFFPELPAWPLADLSSGLGCF